MISTQPEFRDSLRKLILEDHASQGKIYKIMYTRHISNISAILNNQQQSDQIFQEAYLIWVQKLKKSRQIVNEISDAQLIDNVMSLFAKIIHNLLLNVRVSVKYLYGYLKKGEEKAQSRLGVELISQQNLQYSNYLIQKLGIQLLEGQDLLQEAFMTLLKNIKQDKFTLNEQKNEIHIKQLHKYFREIIFRQVHNLYRRDKKTVELTNITIQSLNEKEFVADQPDENIFQSSVYQSFFSLDQVSQKILKYLFVDKVPANQITKLLNHPHFTTTKQIVDHKMECLHVLKKRTAEKINSLESGAFQKYLTTVKNILQKIAEPCKTILQYTLPPNPRSYQEIIQVIRRVKLPQSEFLQTVDQLKKRKYKCMQNLQEEIWKNLLTQNR